MMRNIPWRRKKQPNNFIIIVVDNDKIIGMRIVNDADAHARACLKLDAYWMHAIDGVGLSTSLLDKPSVLMNLGKTIVASGVDFSSAIVGVVMNQSHIHEKWYLLDHASPEREDFSFESRGQSTWSFQYLYPIGHKEHAFYVCEVGQAVAFQYMGSLMSVGIVPTLMTSCAVALMHTYRYYQGAAFRKTQFAVDMAACEYQIAHLISREMVHRLVSINPSVHETQDLYPALAVSVGVVHGMIQNEAKGLL